MFKWVKLLSSRTKRPQSSQPRAGWKVMHANKLLIYSYTKYTQTHTRRCIGTYNIQQSNYVIPEAHPCAMPPPVRDVSQSVQMFQAHWDSLYSHRKKAWEWQNATVYTQKYIKTGITPLDYRFHRHSARYKVEDTNNNHFTAIIQVNLR